MLVLCEQKGHTAFRIERTQKEQPNGLHLRATLQTDNFDVNMPFAIYHTYAKIRISAQVGAMKVAT